MFDFVAFLGIFINPLRQFIQISEKKFEKLLILAITHYWYFRHVIKIVEQITRYISHTLIILSRYWNFKNSRWINPKNNQINLVAKCVTKVTPGPKFLGITLKLFTKEFILNIDATYVIRVFQLPITSKITKTLFMTK